MIYFHFQHQQSFNWLTESYVRVSEPTTCQNKAIHTCFSTCTVKALGELFTRRNLGYRVKFLTDTMQYNATFDALIQLGCVNLHRNALWTILNKNNKKVESSWVDTINWKFLIAVVITMLINIKSIFSLWESLGHVYKSHKAVKDNDWLLERLETG